MGHLFFWILINSSNVIEWCGLMSEVDAQLTGLKINTLIIKGCFFSWRSFWWKVDFTVDWKKEESKNRKLVKQQIHNFSSLFVIVVFYLLFLLLCYLFRIKEIRFSFFFQPVGEAVMCFHNSNPWCCFVSGWCRPHPQVLWRSVQPHRRGHPLGRGLVPHRSQVRSQRSGEVSVLKRLHRGGLCCCPAATWRSTTRGCGTCWGGSPPRPTTSGCGSTRRTGPMWKVRLSLQGALQRGAAVPKFPFFFSPSLSKQRQDEPFFLFFSFLKVALNSDEQTEWSGPGLGSIQNVLIRCHFWYLGFHAGSRTVLFFFQY